MKQNRRGATALTYGLVVGLVSLAAIQAVTTVGESVDSNLVNVADSISGSVSPDGEQPAPTPVPDFTLSSAPNSGLITVSLPAQTGTSTCVLEYEAQPNSYRTILASQGLACGSDVRDLQLAYPQYNNVEAIETQAIAIYWSNFGGGAANVRVKDANTGTVLHTFEDVLTCTSMGRQTQYTFGLDEDCNGRFEESARVGPEVSFSSPWNTHPAGYETIPPFQNVDNDAWCRCFSGRPANEVWAHQGSSGAGLTVGTKLQVNPDCTVTTTTDPGAKTSMRCRQLEFY